MKQVKVSDFEGGYDNSRVNKKHMKPDIGYQPPAQQAATIREHLILTVQLNRI